MVGHDEFGNRYFEEKKPSFDKRKRFVIYNGADESSKVPAEWHHWLHNTSELPPVNINTHKSPWQKIHLPNLTGTKHAYFPPNSVKKDNKTYQSWNPQN